MPIMRKLKSSKAKLIIEEFISICLSPTLIVVDVSVTAAITGCKYQHHTKCIKLYSYRARVSSQKTEFTHLTHLVL